MKAQSSLAKPSKAVPDTDEIVADSLPRKERLIDSTNDFRASEEFFQMAC